MTSKRNAGTDPDSDVELGEAVEVSHKGGSRGPVVAVRVSPDLLARLQEYAAKRRLSVSEVLRRGAEELIDETVDLGPTHVTGSLVIGANIAYGAPNSSTGRSQQREVDEDVLPSLTRPG